MRLRARFKGMLIFMICQNLYGIEVSAENIMLKPGHNQGALLQQLVVMCHVRLPVSGVTEFSIRRDPAC